MSTHPFRQVDVFSPRPLGGNPVAVVHDAEDLDETRMASFAHWTNLSETTYLLPPTHPDADYRLRIFTVDRELPFAGHPTLGSCHAWLEAGGRPQRDGVVVQECGAGLVTIRHGERLAFAAPPLIRSGPVDDAELAEALSWLGLRRAEVVEAAWIDNGPGWMGLLLADADAVLAVRPGPTDRLWDVGLVGPHRTGSGTGGGTGSETGSETGGETGGDVEVRALFSTRQGPVEDPVTGSLNAGIGQWLAGRILPTRYVAAQGTVLGRTGRVHVSREGDEVWVAGETRTVVTGSVDLG